MEITKYITVVNFTESTSKNNKYIVLHYTANNGDTALNNAKYFYDTYRGASAHYFVDENEIVQVVSDKNVAWHCGSTSYVHSECRNTNSIGIEMCSRQYSDGTYYIKDEVRERSLELVHYLMDKYDIPLTNVIRHYDVTGKICPAPFVNDLSLWNDFKSRLVLVEEIVEEEMRYNTVDEIKTAFSWAETTITKLVDNGYLSGSGSGLDLSQDMIRMFVINDRAGMYD